MTDLKFEDKLLVGCISRLVKKGIPKVNIILMINGICDVIEKDIKNKQKKDADVI